MKYIPLIWTGLWRKPTRTIFTLLSIVVAFMLFGLLQGVNAGLGQVVGSTHLNRLLTTNPAATPLPLSYLPQIEAVPGVTRVTYANQVFATYQQPGNIAIGFATDPERWLDVYPEIRIPKDQLNAWITTRSGAAVGVLLAKKYGWKIGDRVPLHSPTSPKGDGTSDWTFDIVSIFDAPERAAYENVFLFNQSYFDEARASSKGTVQQFEFTIKDPRDAADVSRAIDNLFANSPYETKTQSESEAAQSALTQVGDINFFVDAILAAVFFTLLFLTGNAMMQSVRERIPELAILKTLGFSDAGLIALILVESVLLCELGAIAGLGAATVIFGAAKAIIGTARLSPIVIYLGLAAALSLALISGLLPAWRAKRLDIVDALAGR